MKKLLDSESNAVHKCNISAKSVRPVQKKVTPVQITHHNSGLCFAERQLEISMPMISSKSITKIWSAETLKNVFSNAKKMASRKILRHFLHANFLMFI